MPRTSPRTDVPPLTRSAQMNIDNPSRELSTSVFSISRLSVAIAYPRLSVAIQLSVAICGYPWLSVPIRGYPRLTSYPQLPAAIRLSPAICGYPWLSVAIRGYPWLSVAIRLGVAIRGYPAIPISVADRVRRCASLACPYVLNDNICPQLLLSSTVLCTISVSNSSCPVLYYVQYWTGVCYCCVLLLYYDIHACLCVHLLPGMFFGAL